jgi:hypothetical protein
VYCVFSVTISVISSRETGKFWKRNVGNERIVWAGAVGTSEKGFSVGGWVGGGHVTNIDTSGFRDHLETS